MGAALNWLKRIWGVGQVDVRVCPWPTPAEARWIREIDMRARKRFGAKEFDVLLMHEPGGFAGRGCISMNLPAVANMTLRLSLEDAETLGEALITMVRRAEERTQ